jgi:drug/metabolite transporter (DMT)-like permease
MLASFLTTVLFSFSVIFAARSSKVLGPQLANLSRLLLAAAFLAVWAHGFGAGLKGPGLPWFFLSGLIGFGVGDMALFGALPRIGPRLAILLTQCLAAPLAALAEWIWLGNALKPADLGCAAVILGGVAVALAPDRGLPVSRSTFWLGVFFGAGSAFGQGMGAVLSRKAIRVGKLAGFEIDGGTAAYQRILAGVLLTAVAFWVFRPKPKPALPVAEAGENGAGAPGVDWKKGWPLVFANALSGPTLGVGCYQLALKTTLAGLVLPIVATSPLVTLLLAWWIDKERPTRRSLAGGLLAVSGAVALTLLQS